MKTFLSMFLFFSVVFFSIQQPVFADPQQSDTQQSWKSFNDIYFENTRLSNADTFAGYMQLRSGFNLLKQDLEAYAVGRMGADSRTNLDPSNAVYNDNFVFVGIGLDYQSPIRGIVLTTQVGNSFDLNSKLHEGGFDFRTGTRTYHEIHWIGDQIVSEIYSDELYFRRYRNFLASFQYRTVYNSFRWGKGANRFELGPMLNGVFSIDSQGLDYNRFAEVRFGPRLTFRSPITLSLSPFYVWGTQWQSGSTVPVYRDFRVLLTGFLAL